MVVTCNISEKSDSGALRYFTTTRNAAARPCGLIVGLRDKVQRHIGTSACDVLSDKALLVQGHDDTKYIRLTMKQPNDHQQVDQEIRN